MRRSGRAWGNSSESQKPIVKGHEKHERVSRRGLGKFPFVRVFIFDALSSQRQTQIRRMLSCVKRRFILLHTPYFSRL